MKNNNTKKELRTEMNKLQKSTNLSSNKICGIDKKYISNFSDYELLLDEMLCPICLKVLLDPIECNKCQAIICENCHFILKSADKNCFNEGCDGKYIKANKYIRNILNELEIKCQGCQKDNIRYTDYLIHIKSCEEYLKNPILNKIIQINKKTEEIEKLKKEKEELVKAAKKKSLGDEIELRKKYLTNKLSTDNKVKFYKSAIEGNLELYKMYVTGTPYNPPFNILEEVSAPGYGWTTFHYAMHHAKWNIIKFIIEYLISKDKIGIALRLKSNDGRCPLLCLFKSNILKNEVKRETFDKIISNFTIPICEDARKELENRGMKDLLEKIKDKKYDDFEY